MSHLVSHLVFVYGTLKNGHHRNIALRDQHFIGTAVTKPIYRMYQHGGYPALISQNDGIHICGELYEVSDSCMINLDKIECVNEGLFTRKNIELESYNLFALPLYKASSDKLFLNLAFAYFFVDTERLSKSKDCGNNWTVN